MQALPLVHARVEALLNDETNKSARERSVELIRGALGDEVAELTICVNPFSCLPHRRRPLHNPIQKYLTIVAHGTLGAGDIDCLIGVFFERQ